MKISFADTNVHVDFAYISIGQEQFLNQIWKAAWS